MSLRLLLAITATLVALAVACGGGSAVPEDPRVLEIGTLAEEATYALAGGGPAGLYQFLAPEIVQRCSPQQFAKALTGQEMPTGFRGLRKVEFAGEEALVNVIFIVGGQDKDIEWTFAKGSDGTWRLSKVPGLEECR